ncbi:MAG: serine hydrolase, partial [Candidatus Brocadiae bacterium]|nr:serine hydrolase [Candidatus Brocadiia bacterium]
MEGVFPGREWQWADAADAGIDPAGLESAREWLESEAGERPYRAVVARHGRILAEWQRGLGTDERLGIASATKSLFSCVLAIAVAEGKVGSPDEEVIAYYPQMMEVPEGRGPKPGRFAKPEDRGITFRQLISNTSGYMKPGESPPDRDPPGGRERPEPPARERLDAAYSAAAAATGAKAGHRLRADRPAGIPDGGRRPLLRRH